MAVVLLGASEAAGHQMYVFAETDGAVIRGEAYFRGRIPARDLSVTAFDPAGAEIGRTTTDADGKFTLEARFRCDHRLVVKSPDGHGAEYLLAADQLPTHLSPRSETLQTPQTPQQTVASATPVDLTDRPAAVDSQALKSLRDEISRLRASLSQTQRQIRESQEQARIRDIIGGIGWILGLAGIAFYFLGLQRKRTGDKHAESTTDV